MSILSRVVGFISGNEAGGEAEARFVVLSPQNERAGEKKILFRLFENGLSAYHLRRPHWSIQRCREWLESLPAEARSRVVLHQFPQLVGKYGLAGFHVSSDSRAEAALRGGVSGELSVHCEDYASMLRVGNACRTIVFGPVFPPEKYDVTVPRRTFGEYAATVSYWRSRGGKARVLAFGGINSENIGECRRAGFDGVVVFGAVWSASDPVRAFKNLVRKW